MKKVSEKSLENLKKDFTRAERQENGRKGAKKTNQMRAAKIKRENAKEWFWDEYGVELTEDIIKNGSIKDKLALLLAILPNDKQVSDVNFKNMTPEIIVETIEMRQKAEEYTKKLLNG